MKRGSSGLSLALAIDKPTSMSSHDVVNRLRGIFEEKRVGHAGTLDPLATGVLPMLVGPATRLSDELMGHDKSYVARIRFGYSTTTDDSEGELLNSGAVGHELSTEPFANMILEGFVGKQKQLPPAYSAIKVDGTKAYDAARRGNVINLDFREVEVYNAELIGIGEDESIYWDVRFDVSKGTYIRSLARDIGIAAGSQAHIEALQRIAVGSLRLEDCTSLEALETLKERACIDPVRLLGYRFIFAEDAVGRRVDNGNTLRCDDVDVFEFKHDGLPVCECTSGIMRSCEGLVDGEDVSVIQSNTLKAIYKYDEKKDALVPKKIFQIGVSRGFCD